MNGRVALRREPAEVTDLAERARLARSARRRGARRAAGVGLVLLALLAGAAWVLLASTLLTVEAVAVRGTERLTAAQVREAGDVALGTPLARVDTDGVARRIGALPPVHAVEVHRRWPRTVELVVRERVAVAGVVVPGGVRLLDAGGVPFAQDKALPRGVVRLQAQTPGPRDPATRAGLTVLADLPEPLRARLAIVRAASPTEVSLLLRDGREVVWGAPGRTEDKTAAALALLELPGTVYDVRSPDVVIRKEAVPG